MLDALRELKSRLMQFKVLSLDLETTSKDPRVAELEIVALAAGHGASLYSVALPPTPEVLDFVKECLDDPSMKIVGHNLIAYDLAVLHHRGIRDFGKRGARLVDTLPLVWLLDENKDHGLKYSAHEYLGCVMTEYEEAFNLSPNYIRMQELELTKARLIEDRERNIAWIHKEHAIELKRLTEELKQRFKGKHTVADRLERATLLGKAIAYVDTTYGDTQVAKEKQIIEDLTKTIDAQITLSKEAWHSDMFRYAADDAYQTLRLYYMVRQKLKQANLLLWADIEIKNRIAGTAMQIAGMPIDEKRVSDLEGVVVPLIEEFEADLYNTAKTQFNPRSAPQVKKMLYEVLGIQAIDSSISTDEKTLSRLEHPFAQTLLNFRTVDKLYRTYIVKMEKEILKGLPARLYAIFNSIGTVTGRYSSSKPNLQNIPSKSKPDEYDERIQKLGPSIRRVFKDPYKVMISADLSQIELRLIAHVTRDPLLLKVYNEFRDWEGVRYYIGDIHTNTRDLVSKMVGFDIGRKLSKNLNFGLSYGMGALKFARYARLFIEGTKEYDVESAAKFIETFMATYAGIRETLRDIATMLSPTDPKQKRMKYRMLTGRYRRFRREDMPFAGSVLNSIIQGSAADLLKIIVWYIYDIIVRNPEFEGTELTLQVHDEVGLFAPPEIADKVGVLVKYIMERPWFNLTVPVLASVKTCECWADKDNDDVPEIGVIPPKESGIKPAVAMLTKDQIEWAARYMPTPVTYSV
jgi:DNA polymerase I-like protein with 3'-5' exonuclease and polymerase domains